MTLTMLILGVWW